ALRQKPQPELTAISALVLLCLQRLPNAFSFPRLLALPSFAERRRKFRPLHPRTHADGGQPAYWKADRDRRQSRSASLHPPSVNRRALAGAGRRVQREVPSSRDCQWLRGLRKFPRAYKA